MQQQPQLAPQQPQPAAIDPRRAMAPDVHVQQVPAAQPVATPTPQSVDPAQKGAVTALLDAIRCARVPSEQAVFSCSSPEAAYGADT